LTAKPLKLWDFYALNEEKTEPVLSGDYQTTALCQELTTQQRYVIPALSWLESIFLT